MSYPPIFENIEACLRATHRQAWQLVWGLARKVYSLTKKAHERKVPLNGSPC